MSFQTSNNSTICVGFVYKSRTVSGVVTCALVRDASDMLTEDDVACVIIPLVFLVLIYVVTSNVYALQVLFDVFNV